MFKTLPLVVCIKITLILNSLFLYSCDSSSATNDLLLNDDFDNKGELSVVLVEPYFQTIVDRFIFEAEMRNISLDMNNLVIVYGETDGAYGYCSMHGNVRKITINPNLKVATDDFLSEIVLHELGHCVLGRDHSPDPMSIMHASIIIGDPWRAEVLDELFFGS